MPAAPARAQPWRPEPVLLHTGPDRATAERLASNLLPKPAATMQSLLAVKSYVAEWNATAAGGAGGSVPGEVLAMMGLTLGTPSKILAGLYIEPALVREEVCIFNLARGVHQQVARQTALQHASVACTEQQGCAL